VGFLRCVYSFGFWEFFKSWVSLTKNFTENDLITLGVEKSLVQKQSYFITWMKDPRVMGIFLKNALNVISSDQTRELVFYNMWRNNILSGEFFTLCASMALAGSLVTGSVATLAGPEATSPGLFAGALIGAAGGILGATIHTLIPESVKYSLSYLIKYGRIGVNKDDLHISEGRINSYLKDRLPAHSAEKFDLETAFSARSKNREEALNPLIELMIYLTEKINQAEWFVNAAQKLKIYRADDIEKLLKDEAISRVAPPLPLRSGDRPTLPVSPLLEVIRDIPAKIKEHKKWVDERAAVEKEIRDFYFDEEKILARMVRKQRGYFLSDPDFEVQGFIDEHAHSPGLIESEFRRRASHNLEFAQICEATLNCLSGFLKNRETYLDPIVERIPSASECISPQADLNAVIIYIRRDPEISERPRKSNSCTLDVATGIVRGEIKSPEDLIPFYESVADARQDATILLRSIELVLGPMARGKTSAQLKFRMEPFSNWLVDEEEYGTPEERKEIALFAQERGIIPLFALVEMELTIVREMGLKLRNLFNLHHEMRRMTNLMENQTASFILEEFKKIDIKSLKKDDKLALQAKLHAEAALKFDFTDQDRKRFQPLTTHFLYFMIIGLEENSFFSDRNNTLGRFF
jgi:hypothetical protein